MGRSDLLFAILLTAACSSNPLADLGDASPGASPDGTGAVDSGGDRDSATQSRDADIGHDGRMATDAETDARSDAGAECSTPENVVVNRVFDFDLSRNSSDTLLRVDDTDITALPFHTTGGASFGDVHFAETAAPGNPNVVRTMWFSRCPGGEVLVPPGWTPGPSADFFGNPCDVTGVTNQRIQWSQATLEGEAVYQVCGLRLDTDYYFNIRNNTCEVESCNVELGVRSRTL